MARTRTVLIIDALAALGVDDPEGAIAAGIVEAGGIPVTSAAARIRRDVPVRLRGDPPLRGEAKLRAAIEAFAIPVEGRAALDVGAAAGGFTRVLLGCGARRVYACDVGHGQLRGALRQDPRVVNLEATNVADLDRSLIPEALGVISIDVSYLALGEAVRQLGDLELEAGCDLIGLVKPMFELRRATAPIDGPAVAALVERLNAQVAQRR